MPYRCHNQHDAPEKEREEGSTVSIAWNTVRSIPGFMPMWGMGVCLENVALACIQPQYRKDDPRKTPHVVRAIDVSQ